MLQHLVDATSARHDPLWHWAREIRPAAALLSHDDEKRLGAELRRSLCRAALLLGRHDVAASLLATMLEERTSREAEDEQLDDCAAARPDLSGRDGDDDGERPDRAAGRSATVEAAAGPTGEQPPAQGHVVGTRTRLTRISSTCRLPVELGTSSQILAKAGNSPATVAQYPVSTAAQSGVGFNTCRNGGTDG
jgi:hypothetical protein